MEDVKQHTKSTFGNLAFKSGMLYLIAELITRGISFLATPFFTRLLTPVVFAEVRTFETWTYLLAPLLSVNVYLSLPRAKIDFNKDLKKYFSSIIFLQIVITCVIILVVLPFMHWISTILGFDEVLIYVMIIFCLGYSCIQTLQIYDRQILNYSRNFIMTILGSVPSTLISIVIVILFHNKIADDKMVNVRILSFFVPTAIIGVLVGIIILFKVKKFYERDYWKYALQYSAPIIITTISSQIFFQSGTLFVRYLSGIKESALIAIAITAGYIMDIFIHALDNAWKPWLFEKLNKKMYFDVKLMIRRLLILNIIFIIAMMMLGPELILILGGEKYFLAIELLPPILLSTFINFLMITYISFEQYEKNTVGSGKYCFYTILFCLICNYIGIQLFGYRCAAYIPIITYLFGSLLHIFDLHKRNYWSVLNIQFTVKYLVFITIIMVCSAYFYRLGLMIRSILVVVCILGSLFMNYKDIIGLKEILKKGGKES